MTGDEFLTILEHVGALWPNANVERRLTVGYRLLLGDLDVADVREALVALALDGREFAPPPGVVAHWIDAQRTSAEVAATLAEMQAARLRSIGGAA